MQHMQLKISNDDCRHIVLYTWKLMVCIYIIYAYIYSCYICLCVLIVKVVVACNFMFQKPPVRVSSPRSQIAVFRANFGCGEEISNSNCCYPSFIASPMETEMIIKTRNSAADPISNYCGKCLLFQLCVCFVRIASISFEEIKVRTFL